MTPHSNWLNERGFPANNDGWNKYKRLAGKAGIWNEAKTYYTMLRREGGITRHVEAMQMMIEKFPAGDPVEGSNITPLPPQPRFVPPPAPPKKAKKPPTKKKTKARVSNVAIQQWVFENLSTEGLTKADAPSHGAWDLLKDCLENPDIRRDFRKTWMSATMKKEDSQVSEKDVRLESEMESRLLEFEKADD